MSKAGATLPVELLPPEYRELLRVVAELLAKVERLENERTPERPPLRWASRKRYAQHRGVSVRTVAKWLAQGLPAEGAPLRIDVLAADMWLVDRKKRSA